MGTIKLCPDILASVPSTARKKQNTGIEKEKKKKKKSVNPNVILIHIRKGFIIFGSL